MNPLVLHFQFRGAFFGAFGGHLPREFLIKIRKCFEDLFLSTRLSTLAALALNFDFMMLNSTSLEFYFRCLRSAFADRLVDRIYNFFQGAISVNSSVDFGVPWRADPGDLASNLSLLPRSHRDSIQHSHRGPPSC